MLEEDEHNRILNLTFLAVVEFFVLFENTFILLTVRKLYSVKNFDILVACLAFLDLTSAFTVIPIAITSYASEWRQDEKPFPGIWCKISGIAYVFIQIGSTSSVTMVTLDRFVAVKRPFFYRTTCENRNKKLKIILATSIFAVLIFTVIIVSFESETLILRHGICSLPKRSWAKVVILVVTVPQIVVVCVCYITFVHAARKLDQRRKSYLKTVHDRCSSPTTTSSSPPRRQTSWKSTTRAADITSDVTKNEANYRSEGKLLFLRNIDLNRGTRVSATVALIVCIYYVPWISELVSIILEMVTNDDHDLLYYVTTRLVLMDSIFNPLIYARMNRYLEAYKKLTCGLCRPCGCSTHFPIGLTGKTSHNFVRGSLPSTSEIQRVTKRLALEGWESPGINMRRYSNRGLRRPCPCDVIIEGSFSDVTGISGMNAAIEEDVKTDEDSGVQEGMKFAEEFEGGELVDDSGYVTTLSLKTDISNLRRSTSDSCLSRGLELLSPHRLIQNYNDSDMNFNVTCPTIKVTAPDNVINRHASDVTNLGTDSSKVDYHNETIFNDGIYGKSEPTSEKLRDGSERFEASAMKSSELRHHRENEIKTRISSADSNMMVLLQASVDSPSRSNHRIKLQLELFDSASQRSAHVGYNRSRSVDYDTRHDGSVEIEYRLQTFLSERAERENQQLPECRRDHSDSFRPTEAHLMNREDSVTRF